MKWLILCLAIAPAITAQEPGRNEDRNRGQETTRPYALGHPDSRPGQWKGVLVDGGCRDRAAAVRGVRELFANAGQDTGNVRTSERPRSERETSQNADALEHQNTEHAARQPGGGPCAITAGTSAFALLTAKGEWLDFTESGDLKVIEALRSSAKGRRLLSGNLRGGQYFNATVKGEKEDAGPRLRIDSLRVE